MSEPFEYLAQRLIPQREWHDRKAAVNKRRYYYTQLATLLAGATIPIVTLWAANNPYWSGLLTAILGGVVVVAAAVEKLFKFQENWLLYRTVAEALAREEQLYQTGAAEYAGADEAARKRLLAERAETVLSTTTSQYVATHKSTREPSSGNRG